MATTLSSKMQIAIPKKAAFAAGLKAGSRIKVIAQGHTLQIVPDKKTGAKVEDGPAILGYKGRKLSLAQIKAAIASGAAESS